MQSLTAKSISIDDKGFPALAFDVYWDGLLLEGGTDKNCKNIVQDELRDAMNAFLPLVIRIGSLGEDWEAEIGDQCNVTSIKLGAHKMTIGVSLKKDKTVGKGTYNIPFGASIPYADMDTQCQMMVSELRAQITEYREGLSEQATIPGLGASQETKDVVEAAA